MHFKRQNAFQNALNYIFSKMPFKMHKIYHFPEKKLIKNICVPTIPKIFRAVTRNTLIIIWHIKLIINSSPAEFKIHTLDPDQVTSGEVI